MGCHGHLCSHRSCPLSRGTEVRPSLGSLTVSRRSQGPGRKPSFGLNLLQDAFSFHSVIASPPGRIHCSCSAGLAGLLSPAASGRQKAWFPSSTSCDQDGKTGVSERRVVRGPWMLCFRISLCMGDATENFWGPWCLQAQTHAGPTHSPCSQTPWDIRSGGQRLGDQPVSCPSHGTESTHPQRNPRQKNCAK